MIDITITRGDEVTNHAVKVDQAAAEAWVAKCEAEFAFGRPRGYYRLQNGVDTSDSFFLTYDGKWTIPLEYIYWFEGNYENEMDPVPQVWAWCAGEYDIIYKDLEYDINVIIATKSALTSKVNKEVDRIVGNMYSMSEMIMYAMIDGALPDNFLEIKLTIQAA